MKERILILMIAMLLSYAAPVLARPEAGVQRAIDDAAVRNVTRLMLDRHGKSHAFRIERGVKQVAFYWQKKDGSAKAFEEFCLGSFITDSKLLDETFARFEENLESIAGHFSEMSRDLYLHIHLDLGPILPIDTLFSEFSAAAHLQEDLFTSRIAFCALLNFPVYPLEEKIRLGGKWSRGEWARARLADRFTTRVPAEVSQKQAQVYARGESYISSYNIFMHNLLTSEGERLFPEGLKLISHWGLRDELKAQYAKSDGLQRQRMIRTVMERIIRQEIPGAVINNPGLDWDPRGNAVFEKGKRISSTREADVRYAHLLDLFNACKMEDRYSPLFPTNIDRRFTRDREITEEDAERLMVSVLTSKEVMAAADIIRKRLGRPLEDFDIWYKGFKSSKKIDETKLDGIIRQRYPDVASFQRDIPQILKKLGFSDERAAFLADHIIVDPARGAGHAMGAGRRVDKAHLRTRFEKDGMNYKGFNIASHELGHNVEQIFSLHLIDHTLLQGVPNYTFTEAFAFIFQARDLEILGVDEPNPQGEALAALDALWSTFEISGVTLVEMKVWHWLYDHPGAKAAELRQAVIEIAKDVWNRYYAPVIGVRDSVLLAVYSHMIDTDLYLVNYPLGHIIAFQIEEYFRKAPLAAEMERMCRQGCLTPEAWMRGAVGDSVSAAPLLKAASAAIEKLK
jgi:hypothetical protein